MAMYSITWKLNSTFRAIDKAPADKFTAKLVGKNSSFCGGVNNIYYYALFNMFLLLDKVFCLILNEH